MPTEKTGSLIVIATPIGNLGDVSPRASEALSKLDVLATESTEAARRLYSALGLSCPRLESYREENRESAERHVLNDLAQGRVVGLTCEAGTPAISDPGWTLVQACHRAGYPVTGIPGPSAITLALALSGQPTRQFHFEGFLPRANPRRRERLEAIATLTETSVLLESPHGLRKTLDDLAATRGDENPLTVLRELTKKFEEVIFGTVGSCREAFERTQPRGELTLVLGPRPPADEAEPSPDLAPVTAWLREQGLTGRQLLHYLTRFHDLPRREAYALAHPNSDPE